MPEKEIAKTNAAFFGLTEKQAALLAGPGHVKSLLQRKPKSHKGENGIVLILAGSRQYHGAAIFAGIAASRLVDLVLFATPRENMPFVKNASPEFIVHELREAQSLAKKADSILIGPGMEKNSANKKLFEAIVSKNRDKKIVLDATALHLINPKILHGNCVVTPHASEFESLFKQKPTVASTLAMSKKFHCIVAFKAKEDIVSDGKGIYKNYSGNAVMTTGGTGDILAGLIVGFAAKNSLLQSCLAAVFLNGFAADLLLAEKGTMFNAEDLLDALPKAKKYCEGL